ncbi:MAG: immunoglobulin-like domain-containing protein [Anaerocolumna sp.]
MNRRRKHKTIQLLLISLFCIIAIAIGIFCYWYFTSKVKTSVTLEAGSEMYDVKEFLINKNNDASFETDIASLDLHKPGNYDIKINVEGKIYKSTLNIVDTLPPAADVADQAVPIGVQIKADAFLNNINDATSVIATYKTPPDFIKPGDQPVTIVLTDTGNNKTELPATLTILDIKNKIQMEAGTPMADVKEFLNTTAYDLSYESDVGKLNLNKPAVYDIKIKADNNIVNCQLEVTDTAPPTAATTNQEIWAGETPEAEAFVIDVVDVSEVTISYKVPPDTSKAGVYDIGIILKDTSGNQTELASKLTVKEDTMAPVIIGAMDKTVYIGDKVSYKSNVSVTDNKDKDVPLVIDSSSVNLKKAGTYQVVYSATDTSGNKTDKTITVTVKEYLIDRDLLDDTAKNILNSITDSSMTKRDKAYAIYKWVKGHISYTGYSDKSDWVKEAYNGIINGAGDCFTYFAVSKELLTLTDIDNMDVTRIGGTTRHYWSMINTGAGWYHYDSCPNVDHKDSFMLTDSELAALSENRKNNYYNYNKSLYPSTPEE